MVGQRHTRRGFVFWAKVAAVSRYVAVYQTPALGKVQGTLDQSEGVNCRHRRNLLEVVHHVSHLCIGQLAYHSGTYVRIRMIFQPAFVDIQGLVGDLLCAGQTALVLDEHGTGHGERHSLGCLVRCSHPLCHYFSLGLLALLHRVDTGLDL
ncbi:hypothetical protein D3C77_572310 [compost metagenome]